MLCARTGSIWKELPTSYLLRKLRTKTFEASGYGIRRTDSHFEFACVSRELVEKFSKRTRQNEQLARNKYTVLEAQAKALMKSTYIAFEDTCAHVLAEIGGDFGSL